MVSCAAWTTYRHPAIVSTPSDGFGGDLFESCTMRDPRNHDGHEGSLPNLHIYIGQSIGDRSAHQPMKSMTSEPEVSGFRPGFAEKI